MTTFTTRSQVNRYAPSGVHNTSEENSNYTDSDESDDTQHNNYGHCDDIY